MKIAMDFDNTYDRAPAMWNRFIDDAKNNGHSVIVVTCRRDTKENREEVVVPGCTVIFTGLAPKLWYCETQRGINFDVWIDDDPHAITEGK
jgi:hypothetical protein